MSASGIDFDTVILTEEELTESSALDHPDNAIAAEGDSLLRRKRGGSSPRNVSPSNRKKSFDDGQLDNEEKREGQDDSVVATPSKRVDNDVAHGKLLTTEEQSDGVVNWRMYGLYWRHGGYIFVFLSLLVSIGGSGSYTYSSFAILNWGIKAYIADLEGDSLSTQENIYYLNRYALFCSMAIVSATLRTFLFIVLGIRASKKIHTLLLKGVLSSPIAHFDATPVGRILNRFTTDLTTTDENLATNMSYVMSVLSSAMANAVAICYTTSGLILALFGPLSCIYYFVQLFFRASNTQLKRLENVSRSPIYSEFGEAMGGVTSLRAYRQASRVIAKMIHLVDTNSSVWMTQQLIKWWLMIRLEIMGGMITCFIAGLAAANSSFIPLKYGALSLQVSFDLIANIKFFVTMSSEVEAMMNSIERMEHYSESIAPEEPPAMIESYTSIESPNKDWPMNGKISFKDVSLSYHGGPLVLKHINLEVNSKEKIGIAGRTGT